MDQQVITNQQALESLKALSAGLNKANLKGTYNLDESHVLRLALSHIENYIDQQKQ